MICKKEDIEKFDIFIERLGTSLKCFYCEQTFEIHDCDELTSAKYVQTQMQSGIKEFGGPFICPKCKSLVIEEKIKCCIECGKEIKGGIGYFCSLECNISFNED